MNGDQLLRKLKPAERGLVRELLERGWEFSRLTGSGHVKLRYRPTGGTVIVSISSSDWRSVRNLRAQARRVEKAPRSQ